MTRIAVVPGWLAGAALLLAGAPLPAALAVPAVTAAGAFAWARRGRGLPRLAAELIRLRKHARKIIRTGGSVERA